MRTCTVESNKSSCNCTYPCSRKGVCCECISFHRSSGELPACYFSREVERGYDRTVENWLRTRPGR